VRSRPERRPFTLDGKALRTPVLVRVPTGDHDVAFVDRRGKRHHERVEVRPGEPAQLTFQLPR
jgi:hypothetical protein